MAGRAATDARNRLPDPQHASRRRGGDLGLAQSISGQRHQVLLARGFKLDDATERRIEELVFDERALASFRAHGSDIGKAARIDDAIGRDPVFLKSCLPRALTFRRSQNRDRLREWRGLQGRAHVLEELGADVSTIGVDPDGININDGCGAVYPERLCAEVLRLGADIGIALDGDSDRVMIADERGEIFDGDDVMAVLGIRMASDGRLNGNVVVGTVMSNFGLERTLAQHGIRLIRTEVGDPAIVREMRAHGYNLGGEQSGHIIFMDHSTTGDGLITALLIVALMAETRQPLSALRGMRRTPQVLENVRVRERVPLSEMPEVGHLIDMAERQLNGSGRLLVRYSGTEMLARVMVEGDDQTSITAIAETIGEAIRRRIGVAK